MSEPKPPESTNKFWNHDGPKLTEEELEKKIQQKFEEVGPDHPDFLCGCGWPFSRKKCVHDKRIEEVEPPQTLHPENLGKKVADKFEGKAFSIELCPFCGEETAPQLEGFCGIKCYYKYQEDCGSCLPCEDDEKT